jgi:hypothetical protein
MNNCERPEPESRTIQNLSQDSRWKDGRNQRNIFPPLFEPGLECKLIKVMNSRKMPSRPDAKAQNLSRMLMPKDTTRKRNTSQQWIEPMMEYKAPVACK